MSNDKVAATYGRRCQAFAVPQGYTANDEWAVLCDLRTGHQGHHHDKTFKIRWHHETPMP
jgi:hypothetical protein